jgi:hypothetical protein
MDEIAFEHKFSDLLTSDNFSRLSSALASINPAAGLAAGLVGALIVRAAANINKYIATQWDAPIVPPDIVIPRNYDLALRYLRQKGLADTFESEISAATKNDDLSKLQESRDVVSSIASVMDYVLQPRLHESLLYPVFQKQHDDGDFRDIWDHFEDYQQFYSQIKRTLPSPVVKSFLAIVFVVAAQHNGPCLANGGVNRALHRALQRGGVLP